MGKPFVYYTREITPQRLEEAKSREKIAMWSVDDSPEWQIMGYITEMAVMEFLQEKGLKCKLVSSESMTHDIEVTHKGKTYLIDVKCRGIGGTPVPHYAAFVIWPRNGERKPIDCFYFFTSISPDYKNVYILGYIKSSEFLKLAVHQKPGDTIFGSNKPLIKYRSYVQNDQLKQFKIN